MKWYQIEAKKNKKAKILVYGYIGRTWDGEGVAAKQFVKDLMALDVEDIDIHINSGGGNVFEGTAIYNALKSHKANINVFVDGLAASIASVVAMAGDTVEMPENAMLMIHDPSGMVIGTAEDMTKMAEALEKIKTGLVSAYHDKSEMDREKIGELMSDETWMTAAEAVEYGLADKMTARVNVQACACSQHAAQFKNFPSQFITAGISGQNIQKEAKNMKITLEDLEKNHPDIVAQIVTKNAVVITAEFLNTNHPDIVAALAAEAAKKERERIQAVQSQLISGHEDLVNTLMFDGETTGEQAAVKILQAEKDARLKFQNQLDTDAPAAVAATLVPEVEETIDTEDENIPLEDRAKAAWDKNKKIRDEFLNDFDVYLAYLKADAAGQVRILARKDQ